MLIAPDIIFFKNILADLRVSFAGDYMGTYNLYQQVLDSNACQKDSNQHLQVNAWETDSILSFMGIQIFEKKTLSSFI
jgi:hypothetical protein